MNWHEPVQSMLKETRFSGLQACSSLPGCLIPVGGEPSISAVLTAADKMWLLSLAELQQHSSQHQACNRRQLLKHITTVPTLTNGKCPSSSSV